MLRELVKLRASMINGRAYCIDLHWTALRGDGEPEVVSVRGVPPSYTEAVA